jgi:hypothetical protein
MHLPERRPQAGEKAAQIEACVKKALVISKLAAAIERAGARA